MTHPPDPAHDQAHDQAERHRAALGRTLRELRRSRRLRLRDVAAELSVSPATLSAIENGKTGTSSDRVARFAEIFGVPVEQVFDEPGPVRATAEDELPPGGRPVLLGGALPEDGDWRRFPPLVLDPALEGALSAFLEFGYHGATMRTIAGRAGLSVPGLYHYYSSKQEMLVALLDLTMTDLRSRTDAALRESTDPVDRFARLVECLELYHTHRRELAFVGASEMRSLAGPARERVAGVRREEQRFVDAEVEAGVRAGAFATTRPHEAARAVVTMCTALAQWYRKDGPATAETVAAQYVGFALALVGAVSGDRSRAPSPA